MLCRLKLIDIESVTDSTACQMPAGWYRKSPSFNVISSHYSLMSYSSYLNAEKFYISLVSCSILPDFS